MNLSLNSEAKKLRDEANFLWKTFDTIPAEQFHNKTAAQKKAAVAARKATKAETCARIGDVIDQFWQGIAPDAFDSANKMGSKLTIGSAINLVGDSINWNQLEASDKT